MGYVQQTVLRESEGYVEVWGGLSCGSGTLFLAPASASHSIKRKTSRDEKEREPAVVQFIWPCCSSSLVVATTKDLSFISPKVSGTLHSIPSSFPVELTNLARQIFASPTGLLSESDSQPKRGLQARRLNLEELHMSWQKKKNKDYLL